jgi:hypothetical protein
VFTATALFILIIGGSLIWFLFKAGLICARKHTNVEPPLEPAERGRGTSEKKTFSAQGTPNSQEKLQPHPTMGGVFPPSTLLSAEEGRRRKVEPRDLQREGPRPSRQPNLPPLMEAPTPSNLVLPRVTQNSTPPPPGPYTPIQIERHPYAQTRGYGYGNL